MEENEQNKSEQPTPFKLQRARQKGTVARGRDLGFVAGLAAFLGFAWVCESGFEDRLDLAVRGAFISSATLADGDAALTAIVVLLFRSVLTPIFFMAATVFAVVLLFEILQTGFVFSSEALKPDFNRLNPASGLKKLFSVRLLVETGKQVLKLLVYTTVAYLIVRGVLQSDIALIRDGHSLGVLMSRAGLRLLAAFAAVALLFAALDQLIVRRDFLQRMRMSRRELRQELRDREGDPRLKQRRKQLHRDFAKASKSLRNLRKADVLVANPQHIAIALHYDARVMHAPAVVSIGTNQLAQRMKRLAFVYGIPIVENRTLARELHRSTILDASVPERCFQQVADIYIAIRQKREQRDVGQVSV